MQDIRFRGGEVFMDTSNGWNTDATISSVTNHFLVDEMSYLEEDFSLSP